MTAVPSTHTDDWPCSDPCGLCGTTGTYVSDDGDLVIDGVVCCPVCTEELGSSDCCPTPSGAGATLVIAWSRADLKTLRRELLSAPELLLKVGAGR